MSALASSSSSLSSSSSNLESSLESNLSSSSASSSSALDVAHNTPILKARRLNKTFKSRGSTTVALDDVNLTLYPGEVVALIGESGSGKTTLGRAVSRLLALDSGEVIFEGRDLSELSPSELRAARRRFQMIFQNQQAQLHPKMSVMQMVDESLKLHQPQLSEVERAATRDHLLERVGLHEHHLRYLASLSGGEQRRVGLARVLATQPSLIIADEPTSGLDAAIKLQMIALLRELRDQNLTYLLISHDLSLVQRIADRILVMLRGRIIESFPLSELNTRRHHPYTENLIAASKLGEEREESTRDARRSIEDLDETSGDGCSYASICPIARDQPTLAMRCRDMRPPLEPLAEPAVSSSSSLTTRDQVQSAHHVACFGYAQRS